MNIQLIKESKKWWESFDYYDQIWLLAIHDKELLPRKTPLLPENTSKNQIVGMYVSTLSSQWWSKLTEDEAFDITQKYFFDQQLGNHDPEKLERSEIETIFLKEFFPETIEP